jgi:hypothetical protein
VETGVIALTAGDSSLFPGSEFDTVISGISGSGVLVSFLSFLAEIRKVFS